MNPFLVRTASIGLSLAVLVYAAYLAAHLGVRVIEGLMAADWGTYLGQTERIPLRFTVACVLNADCRGAFWGGWRPHYPVYLPLLSLGPLLIGAGLLARLERPLMEAKPPGGARWATKRDLEVYLRGERDAAPNQGYMGYLPSGQMLRVPERLRVSHTLVIGGTGSGKTTRYAKANMLLDARDGWSAVVIDMKHPDPKAGFLDMIPVFEAAGHDVLMVLPYGEFSLRFPLLAGAEIETEANEIASLIVPVQDTRGEGSFFADQERQLMAGLAMGQARLEETSLRQVVGVLRGGVSGLQAFVRAHPDEEVRAALAPLFDFKNDTLAGIVGGLRGRLHMFTDSRLDRVTTRSDKPGENVDLEGLGVRPALLYLGLPEEHLVSGHGQLLLQLVKRTIDRALLKAASGHGGQLPVPVSVYLDEFAALGRLPNVERNFATMRSRRVAYHVMLQNRAQGEAVYGKDFASFVTGNFQQTLIFPRFLGFDDVDYFSRVLRNVTVTERAKSTSRQGFFDKERKGETLREVARPLLSAEEMARWPETAAVALLSGAPPVRVIVPRLDERRVGKVRNKLHRPYWHLSRGRTLHPRSLAFTLVNARTRRARHDPQDPQSIRARKDSPCGSPSIVASGGAPPSLRPDLLVETNGERVEGHHPEKAVGTSSPQDKEALGPGSAAPKVLSEVAVPTAWLREHGPRLEGHPLRDESQRPIGLYEPGAVHLPAEVVEEVLGSVPEGLEGRKQRGHVILEVSLPRLLTLEPLCAWVRDNAGRLDGHPSRMAEDSSELPEAVGVYRPRTLALVKGEEAVGFFSLEGAVERRRFVGGVRKRVLEFTLQGLGGDDEG